MSGQARGAGEDEFSQSLYREAHRIAALRLADDRARRSISATDLVNEAVLKLLSTPGAADVPRVELLLRISNSMRQTLVDRARRRDSQKRGGGRAPEQLDLDHATADELGMDDLLAVDEALAWLARVSPRQAELVELRFFGDFTEREIAEALGCSERTVRGDWRAARAALRLRLEERAR